MKKFLKKVLSVSLVIISIVSVTVNATFLSEARSSITYTENDDFEYTVAINDIDDGTTWVKKYIGNNNKVVIPDEIDGRKVVGIDSYAFEGCSQVTDITIPNSVVKLGYNTFDDTSWYKNLYAASPNGVVYINNIAYCYKGDIPNDGTVEFDYGTISIAGGAFWGEEKLLKIVLPDTITYIGEDAFYCCENLNDFVLPDSVKEIGENSFYECSNLNSITFPDSLENIESYAFSGCSNLTEIVFGKGLTRINSGTFGYCYELTDIIIPDNIRSIDSEAFKYCYNLENISISDNIFFIGKRAFYNTKWYDNQPDGVIYLGKTLYKYKGEMPENESIKIKEGTIGIASSAFDDRANLSSITVPCSVIGFGSDVFYGCDNLTIYSYKNSNAEVYANENEIDFISVGDYVKDFEFSYKLLDDDTVEITKCIGTGTSLKIPYEIDGHTVSALGDYAFMGCANLQKVQIAYNIKKIGMNVFNYESLKEVNFVGSYDDWKNVKSSTNFKSMHFSASKNADETNRYEDYEYNILDNNTIEITGYIGYDTEIDIPDTIKGRDVASIGDESFSDMYIFDRDVIITVNLPTTLKNIGEMAFWNNDNIKEITIPNGVETIGGGAFGGTALEKLFIPESVKYCDHLFDFNILKEITVDENNKNYYSKDGCLFRKSDNVLLLYPYGNERTEYTIPDGTTGIDDYAFFRGTAKLKTLTIPGSVKTLKMWTAAHSNLDKVILNEGVESILKHAFVNCNFKEIYIPKSVTTIEELAFGYDNMDSLSPQKIEGFKIYGYKNTAAEKYAQDNEFEFISLADDIIFSDKSTGITVSGVMQNDAVLNVTKLENTFKNSVATYDITLQKDGAVIQPDGTITVKIPSNAENCKVMWIKDDGTAEDMNAKYTDGCYVFTTDHLSVYALVLNKTILTGDANQDGIVNVNDVTYLQMHIAGKKTTDGSAFIDETNKLLFDCIDMNKDGKLTVTDVTALQIYISKNN